MLLSLRIKNLALVEDLFLEWQPGYSAITGETGAGKSILIGALTLVLGERADRTMIRSGADSCTVEAVFDVRRVRAPLGAFLDENGIEPCEDNQLLLKRSFSNAGSNRQFINGTPTTLNVLGRIGEWLVDIHGPHDHQSLLHPSRQLNILDAYGKLETLREQFAGLVARRAELEARKSSLIVDEKTYAEQLDLLRFQVNEIGTARLQADEEEGIEADYRRSSNAARLIELGQEALNALSENEDSLMTQAGQIGRQLKELEQLDPDAGCVVSLHEQAVAAFRDVQSDLSHYVDRLDVDPARLQEMENRLNLIQLLKRKYGGTLADVIAFGEEAVKKLAQLESRDGELNRINAEIGKVDAELKRSGTELSMKRRNLISKLCKTVESQLADLGFEQSRFEVTIATVALEKCLTSGARIPASGFDTIEFQFSPNVGEPVKPLRAIASSGEMARVMLALKTVLAAEDDVPLLVFDEVDANVGGVTANAVGEKMRQIARNRQVLCITHLAPVAACADAHYVVSKQVKDGRTISEINLLEKKARVVELTRMLGGQGDAAKKHAEALLK